MSPASSRPRAYRPARLALTAGIVLAVAALGIVAGRWQWHRYEVKHEALELQRAAQDIPAVPLGTVIGPDDASLGDAQWRRVTASGALDADAVMALRGRSIDDAATIQYVTWLRGADGVDVLVNLGWLPRDGAAAPELPSGQVTVEGVLRALEPDNGRQGTRIDPGQVGAAGDSIVPAYVMATRVCGDAGCMDQLEPVPLPELSLGPHLSYAFQWWLLAVVAAPIGIAVTRRDARLERTLGAVAPRLEREPRRPRKDKGPSDEEIEDAL